MKIFIAAPANKFTGGPTLAHQLCEQLILLGYDAKMFYYHVKGKKVVHDNYIKFRNPYVLKIEDEFDQVVIVPETAPDLLKQYKRSKKVIWWMSVDNYFEVYLKSRRNKILNLYGALKYNIFSKDTYHFAQSHYAMEFLEKKGIDKERIFYLSDYIDDCFVDVYFDKREKNIKKNQIVYSPKRGLEFTQKIIKELPEYCFIPLSNMTQNQMITAMRESKIYLDFGNHPGKDRIPREAALCKCCIITGRRGAAGGEDVPIDDQFKLEDSDKNMNCIIKMIQKVMENYDKYSPFFSAYCEQIVHEKQEFIKDIKHIFENMCFV